MPYVSFHEHFPEIAERETRTITILEQSSSGHYVQWSGSPPPDPTEWDTITYTYDPAGRRIKKNVDGWTTRYIYDGGHVIAECDGNGNVSRKYIYGARVDEPVCMIDVADNNKAYYYHFDGLGSVVALSNSNGDSCQSYEYSAYGQVAASDPNHPNPYMFTGRRFDIETGLYYYRARYYNPHIGRFMQTDPIGYNDGINWYLYCRNNPLNGIDPSGMINSLASPPALSEVVLLYGIGDAISIYGRGAVIDWIIQTAGTSVVVSGMMVQLLPDPCDNNDPCAPLNSFEKILDDEEIFRYWYRHKKPKSRGYDETEILKIIDKLEEYKIGGCGSGRADPPHKDGEDEWEWHFHPDPEYADNKKIPITEEAYELLKKLGF